MSKRILVSHILCLNFIQKKTHIIIDMSVFINYITYGDRGIRTLAPVARPTPLAGAPLQPLEYVPN